MNTRKCVLLRLSSVNISVGLRLLVMKWISTIIIIEKMTEHMQLAFTDTTTTVFNELYTMRLGLCIIICLHIKMFKDG